MSSADPFVDRVVAMLTPLGPVRARRMFGAHGLFLDDRMFAIVASGRLYLKADARTAPAFRDAGARPFTYRRRGREVALGYWSAPEGALEGMAELRPWAERALAAAERARSR